MYLNFSESTIAYLKSVRLRNSPKAYRLYQCVKEIKRFSFTTLKPSFNYLMNVDNYEKLFYMKAYNFLIFFFSKNIINTNFHFINSSSTELFTSYSRSWKTTKKYSIQFADLNWVCTGCIDVDLQTVNVWFTAILLIIKICLSLMSCNITPLLYYALGNNKYKIQYS